MGLWHRTRLVSFLELIRVARLREHLRTFLIVPILVILLISLTITGGVNTALVPAAVLALADRGVWPLPGCLLLKLDFLLELLLVEVLIMIVALEVLLEFVLIQELHVCLDLLVVLILPLCVRVVGIKVIFIWWNEGRGIRSLH